MKCTSLTPTAKCGITSKKMKTPTVAITARTATEAMPLCAGRLGDVVKGCAPCGSGRGIAKRDLCPVNEARFDMHMSLLTVTPDGGCFFCRAGLLAGGSWRALTFPPLRGSGFAGTRSPLTVAGAADDTGSHSGKPAPHSRFSPDALRLGGTPCPPFLRPGQRHRQGGRRRDRISLATPVARAPYEDQARAGAMRSCASVSARAATVDRCRRWSGVLDRLGQKRGGVGRQAMGDQRGGQGRGRCACP